MKRKKTTVYLPKDVHKALKVKAALLGRDMGSLVAAAVKAHYKLRSK